MPLLSIVTINYNNREGLERTIRSVAAQQFPGLDYVVIDGGSTDGSAQLLQQYAEHITYAVSEKDDGVFNAQNKGIRHATGTYLLFLNSGDVLAGPDVLKTFFSRSPSADLVCGNLMMVGHGEPILATNPQTIGAEHFWEGTLLHPGTFIRKRLFDEYGLYDEGYKIGADYEFFVRVLVRHNATYEYRNQIVAHFEMSGISSDPRYEPLHKAERSRVLNHYFTPLQLAALKELFELKNNPQIWLLGWMNKVALVRLPLKMLTSVYLRLRG